MPALTQGTVSQPFRYMGEQRDSESGFYDLRARYYAPTLGRFLGRDRWAGIRTAPMALNREIYASDNPLRWTDPSGLVTIGGCFSGAAGAGLYVGFSVCLSGASNGDVGVQASVTVGGTTGITGSFGVGPQVSNGNQLSDLSGPFGTTGGSVRLGPGVGADVFWGPNNRNDLIVGGSFSYGVGASWTPPLPPGFQVHGGVNDTFLNVYCNLPSLVGQGSLHYFLPGRAATARELSSPRQAATRGRLRPTSEAVEPILPLVQGGTQIVPLRPILRDCWGYLDQAIIVLEASDAPRGVTRRAGADNDGILPHRPRSVARTVHRARCLDDPSSAGVHRAVPRDPGR